jgi:SPP1 family predicted phage head-tail adaptor
MRFDAVIELVALTYTEDAIGQQVESPVYRSVYANEFTLSMGEFYEAGQQQLRPERQYQLHACDYLDETKARVGGVEYDVIRVARKGEWTMLTLGRKAANA